MASEPADAPIMSRDEELWGVALALNAKLGEGAQRHASARLDDAERNGDPVGTNLWHEISARLSRLTTAETVQ